MKVETVAFAGDVPGVTYELRVLRFSGSDPQVPKAYLQSALHGSELPGQAAIHYLVPMLERAEIEGRLAGDVTIVPQANPIGSSQWLSRQHLGRFELFSSTNFNRSFPLLENFDTDALPELDAPVPVAERLKAQLLRLALPHEIVLDLHCDDESDSYIYVHKAFWPAMSDLAVALGSTSALLWDDTASAAFEEACASPVLAMPEAERDLSRRAVTTIEFRGLNDVDIATGQVDAQGLYRFLVGRGVVVDESERAAAGFSGNVTPLEQVEMIRAPEGGMILFHVTVGDSVEEGDALVTIVPKPGDRTADIVLKAPQAGYILTRRSHRYSRRGDDLLKLLGSRRSETAKPGTLEA